MIQKDLVLLLADDDMLGTFKALLERPADLGIRQIDFDFDQDVIIAHGHDPHIRTAASSLLRSYLQSHKFALAVLDYHGSGADNRESAEALRVSVKNSLAINGWNEKAEAVVIDPELEVWAWGSSEVVADVFDWKNAIYGNLDNWLIECEDVNLDGNGKYSPPKRALNYVLKQSRVRKSARNYYRLAARMPVTECKDPAFIMLKSILQNWFPSNPSA